MNNRYQFAGVYLALPPGWADVTDALPSGTPPTLSKGKTGRGALQISSASYSGAERPRLDRHMLHSLLRDFAERHQFPEGAPIHELGSKQSDVFGASVECLNATDFIKAWYVSDGADIALVTFVIGLSDLELVPLELYEAEELVQSIGFAA